MTAYTTFERKIAATDHANLHTNFYEIDELLRECSHLLGIKEWHKDDPTLATATYLAADYMPLVEFYLEVSKRGNNNGPRILIGAQHFFGEEKRFPELEAIAEAYELAPNKPFSQVIAPHRGRHSINSISSRAYASATGKALVDRVDTSARGIQDALETFDRLDRQRRFKYHA